MVSNFWRACWDLNPEPMVRSQALYPVELQAHNYQISKNVVFKDLTSIYYIMSNKSVVITSAVRTAVGSLTKA